MHSIKLTEALGYAIGDSLTISAEVFDARVARVTPRRVLIDWPWREVDPNSETSWDGTIGFPRGPDAYDWCNTPWRLEPDPSELKVGQMCLVGIPLTMVKVTLIEVYEPPADFGFLPRPDFVLGVVPLEYLGEEEAGYSIYLNGQEPINLEIR